MKKHIFIGAALLAILAVSCDKADVPSSEPAAKGVPMTLTATIVSADTKVDVVDDETNKVLKCNWEVGDKVSVISLDASNNVLANDIFDATAAGKTAAFNGTFTGGSAARVVVIYPALTGGIGSGSLSTDKWHSDPSHNGTYISVGILQGVTKSYNAMQLTTSYYLQRVLNSAEHLENYLVMSGEADMTDLSTNKLTVNLVHRTAVLKVKLTLPASGKTIKRVTVFANKADATDFKYVKYGWLTFETITSTFYGNDSSNNMSMNLGASIEGGNGSGLTVSGTTATVYIPFVPNGDTGEVTFNSGDKLTVRVLYSSTESVNKELVFSSAKTVQAGKLYTINASY